MRSKTFATVIAVTVALLIAAPLTASAKLRAVPVKKGLNGPSGFTFAPDGTIWYLERGTGEVHHLVPKTGADHLVTTISGVNGSGERGALGIALHPAWPKVKLVYVYVTRPGGGHLQNQLVRFKVTGGSAGPLRVLFGTPASSDPYHNGGRILFGPDDRLYVMIGEGHNPENAQDRSGNLRGKILRLKYDGTAAPGNPYGRIWSYGHRNSFGFTFDPHTGRLWETENGPECTDEINLIVRGANFGWGPKENCSLAQAERHEQFGANPAVQAQGVLLLDDRDHRGGLLSEMRARQGAERRPRVRGRRHEQDQGDRSEQEALGVRRQVSDRARRADGGALGRSKPCGPDLLQRAHRDLAARQGLAVRPLAR